MDNDNNNVNPSPEVPLTDAPIPAVQSQTTEDQPHGRGVYRTHSITDEFGNNPTPIIGADNSAAPDEIDLSVTGEVGPNGEVGPIGQSDSALTSDSFSVEVAEQDAPDTEQTVTPVTLPERPVSHARQESEIFFAHDAKSKLDPLILPLPADTVERTEAAVEAMPNIDVTKTDTGNEWADMIYRSKYIGTFGGWFTNTIDRPDSSFEQSVPSEIGRLAAAQPKFNNNGNVMLTGEQAVMRVRQQITGGSVWQIPLWHSGFWINVKAPTESRMLEFYRKLVEEKIDLGRSSWGLAFSNVTVFFSSWLVDFVIDHIFDTTLRPEIQPNIRDYISTHDIPTLAWGMAAVIWPRGFPYARSVLDPTLQTNKVIREKIDIRKIQWVDTAALTKWQVAHMASRKGTVMTADSLQRYRDEFTRGKARSVELPEGITITLRVPTINQYFTSGQKWINNIVKMVEGAFGVTMENNARNTYIQDQSKATSMRQMSHWIDSISVAGDQISQDIETLESTLDVLSSEDTIRTAYFEAIKAYIEDSCIVVIGVPVTEEGEKSPLPRAPNLIPIDAVSVFFTLLVQKAVLIQNRNI